MISCWKKIDEYLYIREQNNKIFCKIEVYGDNYFVAKIKVASLYCIAWDLYSFGSLFEAIIFTDIQISKRNKIDGFGFYET